MAQAALVCRTDTPAAPHAPLQHHMVDCALCPHAAALHGHTMLPVDTAGLVPPRALTFLRLVWAHGARAPPAPLGVTAYPRGPPDLI